MSGACAFFPGLCINTLRLSKMFVSAGDFEDFADFLRENVLDLICIHGKIGNDGVWFSTAELEKAVFL